MAKRVKLQQAFADLDEGDETPAVAEGPEVSGAAGGTKTATATKKAAASKKKTASGRKRGSGAKKTATKQATAKKTAPAADEPTDARTPRTQIRVKGASTAEAEKFLVYVHPDYWKALELAKVDDRVDRQSRIRAMIALWNEDPIFRAAVDRIASKAPRGQH